MTKKTTDNLALAVSERDHIHGPMSAPVTLVEYGDYECPYCGLAHSIVKELQKRLGNRLRFVFRNFPLTQIHRQAQHAAEAAEAAGAQDKFWEMHDTLFEHQHALEDRHLKEYSGKLGIDKSQFSLDLTEHRYAARVREDLMSGIRSGVNGTPTFFINGIRYDGSDDFASLLSAIEDAAEKA